MLLSVFFLELQRFNPSPSFQKYQYEIIKAIHAVLSKIIKPINVPMFSHLRHKNLLKKSAYKL